MRFQPLLRQVKRVWNVLLLRLQPLGPNLHLFEFLASPFDWHNVVQVRNWLIMAWRFLGLLSLIDLARKYGLVSRTRNKFS